MAECGAHHGNGPADPRVLGDTQLQSRTLEDLATAVRYHAWLTGLARPYLGSHPLELGSGLGDYAQRWLEQGLEEITTTDLDPSRLRHLRDRFSGDNRVSVEPLDVLKPHEGSFSSLVAFNVLEHITDHIDALAAAHRLVVPGGAVVMFVPAFNFAMSDFDRRVGHVRRYSRRSLREAYLAAGLTVERLDYVNIPGIIAWVVGMKWLRMTPGDGPLLKVWDRGVIPTTRRLEERLRAPFGQSLFAVGRVPS